MMKTLLTLAFTTVFGTYALGLLGFIDMDRPAITIASAKTMWNESIAPHHAAATQATPVKELSFTERISARTTRKQS